MTCPRVSFSVTGSTSARARSRLLLAGVRVVEGVLRGEGRDEDPQGPPLGVRGHRGQEARLCLRRDVVAGHQVRCRHQLGLQPAVLDAAQLDRTGRRGLVGVRDHVHDAPGQGGIEKLPGMLHGAGKAARGEDRPQVGAADPVTPTRPAGLRRPGLPWTPGAPGARTSWEKRSRSSRALAPDSGARTNTGGTRRACGVSPRLRGSSRRRRGNPARRRSLSPQTRPAVHDSGGRQTEAPELGREQDGGEPDDEGDGDGDRGPPLEAEPLDEIGGPRDEGSPAILHAPFRMRGRSCARAGCAPRPSPRRT